MYKIMYNNSNGIRPLRPYRTRPDTPGRHQAFLGRCFGAGAKGRLVDSLRGRPADLFTQKLDGVAWTNALSFECPHFKLCRLSERGKASSYTRCACDALEWGR
jgi:hypothetical protein